MTSITRSSRQRSSSRWISAFCALGLVSPAAEATLITYNPTNVGGNSWQYDFTVVNDTLGSPLEEFSIFFDVGLYDSIAIVGTPLGWDGLAIQPDAGIPDDGFSDYLALVDGLSQTSTQGGFQVAFNWLAGGLPGDLRFTVVDPVTFETLESGTATASTSQPPTSVPEPMTLSLLLAGLAGGWLTRRKRR